MSYEALRARKSGDKLAASIYNVLLGEIDLQEAMTDEEIGRMAKRVLEGVEESLKHRPDDEVLLDIVPISLSAQEIHNMIMNTKPLLDEVRNSQNPGKATGSVMKSIKSLGMVADGKVVQGVVKEKEKRLFIENFIRNFLASWAGAHYNERCAL